MTISEVTTPDLVVGALAGRHAVVEVGGSEIIEEDVDIIVFPAVDGALLADRRRGSHPTGLATSADKSELGEDFGGVGTTPKG